MCGIGLWSCAVVVEVVDRQDSQRLPGGFCFAIRFFLPFGVAITISSSCSAARVADSYPQMENQVCCSDFQEVIMMVLLIFLLFQQFSRSKITRNEFSEAKKELEGLHRHQSSCVTIFKSPNTKKGKKKMQMRYDLCPFSLTLSNLAFMRSHCLGA